MDHDEQPPDHDDNDVYQTETFVFTGNDGPAFLTTVQNLVNRMIRGEQSQGQQQDQQEQRGQSAHPEQHAEPQEQEQPRSEDTDMPAADAPSLPNIPVENRDEEMPPQEQPPNGGESPTSRPIRPLPRPHTHFHAHTPGGVIDLFTFNIPGLPQQPPPGTATFTFNFGPEFFAGFEGFFQGGMQKDREPDPERGKVLLKGMEVVPEGLVRRLERTGGVSSGKGTEETAGCAVCWGPLLDEIEPGEWDTAKQKEEKAKMAAGGKVQAADEELHGRVVALPCAHVYHAECLQPWFSRNTTCPMCRFDIDPESLTWLPRPPVTEQSSAPTANDTANDTAADAASEARTAPQDASAPQAEHPQPVNAAEADRLHVFMNMVFRAVPLAHPQPEFPVPPNQPQPQSQPQPQPQPQTQPQPQRPSAPLNQPQSQPQPQIHSPPEQNQSPEQTEPPVFGPTPPPPPPPNAFVLPPLFRMPMPLFIVPQPTPPTPSGTHVPPPAPVPEHPQPVPVFNGPHPALRPNFFNPTPQPQPHAVPPFHVPHPPQGPPRERKVWAPPEPVGKTLRQRVEEKERELGLRCDDMICGIAPSDEDPNPVALQSEAWTKRIKIKAAYDGHGKACEHSFHPTCLVTSARVAGVTGDEDGESTQEDEVQVACPVCRAVGSLNRAEWDRGVQASLAEMSV